jgi:succinoglycan biosynthesis transport protein ExoP
MLDANNRQPLLLSEERPAADEPSTAEMLTSALGVVRRRFLVVTVLTLVGAVLGGLVFLKSPPKYTATTTLLVDTRKIEIVQQPTISSDMSIQSAGAMESQVALLKSDEIAFAVIKKLDLLNDPRFIGTGKPGALTGFLRRIAPSVFHEPAPLTEEQLTAEALAIFEKGLTADRVGVTFAIEIDFESTSADLAAAVANAVAEAYIDRQRSSGYDAARRASDWLEERIPELRAKSEAAQRAVVEYESEHNIVETSSGQSIDDQRVADLLTKLNAARDDTAKAKAKFDQFSVINGLEVPSSLADKSSDSTSESSGLQKLRDQYFELGSKEADLLVKYGPNNPAIISIHNQKTQLQSEISEEIQRLKQSSKNDYAVMQVREAAIKSDFDTAVARSHETNHAQVKLRELEASAKAYQDLYNTFVNRYNASLQEAASPVAEASIITTASPLIQPDAKKTLKLAALFPLGGLALGLGIALLRELLGGRVFRTSKSVQSRLRIPCVGLLPKAKDGRARSRLRARKQQAEATPGSIVRGDNGICWAVADYPFSRFSEGVRSIKLAIEMENKTRPSKVIGFTSALPHEGKSTVALAVGQLIARNGSRVVVIDGDLRNPSLTRSVAPSAASGLIELMRGETSPEDAIWKDQSSGLSFVPVIAHLGTQDPPSVLSSAELKTLLDGLRKQYDYILVDLSPLAPVIDVCATTDIIDAYVFVIEWGRTTIDVVQNALRGAPDVANAIIGAVLNKADIKELASYDPYLTSYYFDKGGYGYTKG